jgi:hypothetical protein
LNGPTSHINGGATAIEELDEIVLQGRAGISASSINLTEDDGIRRGESCSGPGGPMSCEDDE